MLTDYWPSLIAAEYSLNRVLLQLTYTRFNLSMAAEQHYLFIISVIIYLLYLLWLYLFARSHNWTRLEPFLQWF